MKKFLLLLGLIGSNGLPAQVGIGTTSPLASIHVHAFSSNSHTSILKVTNSNNSPVIEYDKDGNLGVNTAPNSNLLSINSSNVSTPTLKFSELAIFNDYITSSNVTYSLGISNSGQINKQTTLSTNYLFIKKGLDSGLFNSSAVINDQNLFLDLTPGKYELQAQIVYSSGSARDIEVGLVSNLALNNSYFYGQGHYATFTLSNSGSPYFLKPITTANNMLVFGGSGTSQKMVATLIGYVEITTPTKINLIYKQQSSNSLDTQVYSESNLFAKKI